MVEMHIKEQWNRLDPVTQRWLIENPGCVILPRTITAVFNKETAENSAVDQHGETVLTDEDRNFIQAKAREMKPATAGYRFFDAVGP
jgi:hypothetical protein